MKNFKPLDYGILFCDGASSGNPGPGGWGTVLSFPTGEVLELGGYEPHTTNNRMELLSLIRGLERVSDQTIPFRVYTDSTYVIRGATQWVFRWMKTNWISSEGKEVANQDLWKQLLSLIRGRTLEWHYVRGHSGVPGNERVDEIAVSFSQRRPCSLYRGDVSSYLVSLQEIPENTELPVKKSPQATPAQPYSYLSLVNQLPKRHLTWKDCEARVKGQSGARFKKALTPQDELKILNEWGFGLEDL